MTDPGRRHANELGAELEAKLVAALASEWRGLNYTLFKSALRPPVIRLGDGEGPLAAYEPDLRSLVLARELVLGRPWVEVIERLKQLAVEQFVHERLSVEEHRRGPTYRRICVRLGIHPVPLDAREPELGSASAGLDAIRGDVGKRLARIRKLLALAGSPNQNEAETAALLAQRLLLELNLDRGQAGEALDPALDGDPDPRGRAYAYRHLGPPRPRLAEHDQRLAKLLADHFFVETAWVPIYLPQRGARAMLLEVCGLDFNLAMAEHVHAFLRATAARLWLEYRAAQGLADSSDRQAFLAGVLQGFEAKLVDQQRQLAEQGLVWIPGPDLYDYFRARNPRLRHAAGRGPGQGGEAFGHGHAAGRAIVLAPPVASSSARTGPPRALPASGA